MRFEVQTVPVRIHSGRIPPHNNLQSGTEDSGEGFHGTGPGPFRPLIVSNLKWGGPCRGHYVFQAG